MSRPPLLYAWVGLGLSVLVPKKRGPGFLRTPYGHHDDPGLNAIAGLAGCDIFGLDGSLDFQVGAHIYHGGPGARAEFVGRVMPALEKLYEASSYEINLSQFWDLHPLKTTFSSSSLCRHMVRRCSGHRGSSPA